MRTTIAIISALAATAAASTVYDTVDVTITSCPPEVSSCPGEPTPAPEEPKIVYSTVDVTITSCGPEVSSCPGKPTPPATYPAGSETHPTASSEIAVPSPSEHSSYPPAPPASSVVTPGETHPPAYPSASPSTPAEHTSVPYGYDSSVAPYPTSVVTIVTSSKGPVGTGTGVISPGNATSTYPPIASYTGAASSLSGSFGAVAGLAAIAAFFMA